MTALLGLVAAVVGAILTWHAARKGLAQTNEVLSNSLKEARQRIGELEDEVTKALSDASAASASQEQRYAELSAVVQALRPFKAKYKSVRQKLEESFVVRTYHQPVILTGPRAVGKSSLMKQWHTPWYYEDVLPNRLGDHIVKEVPIYDFERLGTEPHFADPEIKTNVKVHLKLRVHDFPGELDAQPLIIKEAIRETRLLRDVTGKDLGLVLICMFNAENAHEGADAETRSYYNGDFFRSLREVAVHTRVRIDRIIIVYNKFDLLKQNIPDADDAALVAKCDAAFEGIVRALHDVCNSERFCRIPSILVRGNDMVKDNRGAPIVMGEAARRFVGAIAGPEKAQEVFPEIVGMNTSVHA